MLILGAFASISKAQLQEDDALIAWFDFNGNANDLSANGFNATLVGPSNYTNDRFGNSNRAFAFNGENYFTINNTNENFKPTTFPFSVSAWLRIPSDFQGQFTFFKNDFAENIYSGIRGTIIPSGLVTIGIENGQTISTPNRRTKTGTTNIKDGQWHLITCVVRGLSDMDIYVDCSNDQGSYSGSATTIGYSASNPGIVGAYDGVLGSGGFEFSRGSIDQLFFIKKALTQDDVNALFFDESASIFGNLTICQGQETTITATGGTSYLWSNGATTSSITVSEAGTYNVIISNGNNCSRELSAIVEVLSPIALEISAPNGTTSCGGNVALTANVNSSFVWNDGSTENPRTVSTSGTYFIQTAGTCASTSNSIEVNVYDNPATPEITPSGNITITQGNSVTLQSSEAASYEWMPTGETTSSIEVNSNGAFKVRITDENGCTALSNEVVVSVIPPVVTGSCSAAEVVQYDPKKDNAGNVLPASRQITSRALGAAQNSDETTSEENINFVALGFGGSITLRMDGPIANGPGDDIKVFETTFNPASSNCNRYPERVAAYASQDNCNWVYLGQGCQDQTFDLGELNWAEYIKLIDVSPVDHPFNNSTSDGYDVDGVECLNGPAMEPVMQDLNANNATSVVAFSQTTRKDGAPIAAARSNPEQALGAPQNTNTVNFVSLGFSGSITLKLGYVAFDKDGNDIQVIETSFNNPTCGQYAEKANVELSLDGNTYYEAGNLCLDGSVDIAATGLTGVQYVRISDRSPASFFSGSADGYDVDGVVVLQPGCSTVQSQRIDDNTWTPDEIAQVSVSQMTATNQVNVEISNTEKAQQINIDLLSIDGRIVSSQRINTNENSTVNSIVDLSGVNAGIYLVNVRGAEMNQSFKVVKH